MKNELFMNAEEVATELRVSVPFAYKLIREMNAELKQKGYLIIRGKVSRTYFYERIYNGEKAVS